MVGPGPVVIPSSAVDAAVRHHPDGRTEYPEGDELSST